MDPSLNALGILLRDCMSGPDISQTRLLYVSDLTSVLMVKCTCAFIFICPKQWHGKQGGYSHSIGMHRQNGRGMGFSSKGVGSSHSQLVTQAASWTPSCERYLWWHLRVGRDLILGNPCVSGCLRGQGVEVDGTGDPFQSHVLAMPAMASPRALGARAVHLNHGLDSQSI